MDENPYLPPQDVDSGFPSGTLQREIVLQGSIPVADVLHTQVIILKNRWPYLVLCMAIYLLFVVVLGMLSGSRSIFSNTFLVLGLVVMPGILPLSLLMIYLRLRRDSQRKVGIFAATESKLTDTGIQACRNGESIGLPWSNFRGFLASPRVIVLFLHESQDHLIISRAKLKRPEDWQMLLDFLQERLHRVG